LLPHFEAPTTLGHASHRLEGGGTQAKKMGTEVEPAIAHQLNIRRARLYQRPW